MKEIKKERVIVDIEYGSDFQEEVNKTFLLTSLYVLQMQMESKHKKNKLDYQVIDMTKEVGVQILTNSEIEKLVIEGQIKILTEIFQVCYQEDSKTLELIEEKLKELKMLDNTIHTS